MGHAWATLAHQLLPPGLFEREHSMHCCMIRKLEWTSGHSGLTFRSRQEGSCPGTYGFEGSVPGFYKQHPSLWGKKVMGPKGCGIQQCLPPPRPNVFLLEASADLVCGVIISSHKVTKDLLLKGAVWGVHTPCIKAPHD